MLQARPATPEQHGQLPVEPELPFPQPDRPGSCPDPEFVTRPIRVAGRLLSPTPVFESYWRFAAERHDIYLRRLAGHPAPWTSNPIIAQYRFTNAYRAADRVSQYLIRNVVYAGSQEIDETIFRVLLFKFFNKINTWELLCARLGFPTWRDFDYDSYKSVLEEAKAAGTALYSPAYVVPPPRLDEATKHANHLRLLELMMYRALPDRVIEAQNLANVYEALIDYPSVGRFLAFQFAIDLNYSSALSFSEMDFVVAGPGARDGVRKCFGSASSGIEEEIITYAAKHQQSYFEALGLDFDGLFGRPLQLVDCQNLFCEVDKYARVAHPEFAGVSGRQRIKQRYRMHSEPLSAWFPPGWNLNTNSAYLSA